MRRTYNISKHSYIKGRKGAGRAIAHVRYIQYRDGEDKDRTAPGRPFFDKERDEVLGLELKRQLEDWDGHGVAMHKIMLSPSINGVDLKEYTREVMEELSSQKGQELDWKAVEHKNTDHHHVHVCIMGKDLEGHDVRINLKDLRSLEESGNRYLEREHFYDRFLDRQIDRMLERDDYQREGNDFFKQLFYNPERFKQIDDERQEASARIIPSENWDREQAIRELPDREKIFANEQVYTKFNTREELLELNNYIRADKENYIQPDKYDQMWTWIGVKNRAGDDFYEKEARGVKDFREYEEFKRFEEDMRRAFAFESGEIPRTVRGEQRILEQQGRLSDYHFLYARDMDRQRIEEIAERNPDMNDWAQKEVERLEKFTNDHWQTRNVDLDKLLYGCDDPWYPWERGSDMQGEHDDETEAQQHRRQKNTEDDSLSATEFDMKSPEEDEGKQPEDDLNIRIDLIGGRPQLSDEERGREENRDHYGNEM
jgi:hypothetical protein